MKEKKVTDLKEVKKEAKILELRNFMFEVFTGNSQHSQAIAKLKINTSGVTAYELIRFIKKITESPEAKAYAERRNDLIKEFQAKQEELPKEERKPPMPNNIVAWQELLDMDSGFKIEKMKLNVSKFPTFNDPERMINAFDMEVLEIYFDLA